MQAITLDDPFRADADVLGEQPLQGSNVQAVTLDEILDLGNVAVAGDRVHHRRDPWHLFVRNGLPLAKKTLQR